MKKKMLLFLQLMAVILLLCACTMSGGSFSVKKEIGPKQSEHGVETSYEGLKGERFYSKEMKAGGKIAFEVVTESGEMKVSVKGPDRSVILETTDASGEIPCEKDGTYTVTFVTDGHSGGYRINW